MCLDSKIRGESEPKTIRPTVFDGEPEPKTIRATTFEREPKPKPSVQLFLIENRSQTPFAPLVFDESDAKN